MATTKLMATTNTELYQSYRGPLRVRLLRFAPLTLSGIRTTAKKKIPLVLLFAPPLIGTVVFSFLVYARYAPEAIIPELGANQTMAEQISDRLAENLGVKRQIVEFTRVLRVFTILAIAWFGCSPKTDNVVPINSTSHGPSHDSITSWPSSLRQRSTAPVPC